MEPSLHIAIPSLDGRPHVECMMGVLECWGRWPCQLDVVRGSFLPRSRDLIIAGFLADKTATHLLSVDSDMEWHAGDVARLLELGEDFVFGSYVGKRPEAPMMASRSLGVGWSSGLDAIGEHVVAHEYERCGAGFLLISRACVERMVEHYAPTDTYLDAEGRELVGLWQTSGRVELDGRMVAEGEDYAFCRRWRAIGGRIFTRDDVRIGHIGPHTWR
jgi:hypothetical protein